MILITTDHITDPRVTVIDDKHPLWFDGSNMVMLRECLSNPSDEAKKALNALYRDNRDGVAIISCNRLDIATEVRRMVYKKSSEVLGAPAGGKTTCSCSLTIEYLKENARKDKTKYNTVENKQTCDRLLIKEFEMFTGFVITPELFMEKLIARNKLDRKKFTNAHYDWAAGKPFRVVLENVEPLDSSGMMPQAEIDRLRGIKIDFLYSPPQKPKVDAESVLSEDMW